MPVKYQDLRIADIAAGPFCVEAPFDCCPDGKIYGEDGGVIVTPAPYECPELKITLPPQLILTVTGIPATLQSPTLVMQSGSGTNACTGGTLTASNVLFANAFENTSYTLNYVGLMNPGISPGFDPCGKGRPFGGVHYYALSRVEMPNGIFVFGPGPFDRTEIPTGVTPCHCESSCSAGENLWRNPSSFPDPPPYGTDLMTSSSGLAFGRLCAQYVSDVVFPCSALEVQVCGTPFQVAESVLNTCMGRPCFDVPGGYAAFGLQCIGGVLVRQPTAIQMEIRRQIMLGVPNWPGPCKFASIAMHTYVCRRIWTVSDDGGGHITRYNGGLEAIRFSWFGSAELSLTPQGHLEGSTVTSQGLCLQGCDLMSELPGLLLEVDS